MTHKGENYSVKLQKYYFCNGTIFRVNLLVLPCLSQFDEEYQEV
ncbi:MAG: hypothetical protein QG646_2026, partial [Euryarchaeota archaeon]|nr:hypothetical protein [Euryarchaeota archaeon]